MDSKADHYKLLGIDSNASADAIRQAYKKKALEWHPDKRDDDIYAEEMFKKIKKAYEILSGNVTKLEYDAERDDDDDTIVLDAFQLTTGKRPSQMYEEKIAGWIAEYSNQTFIDNVDVVMANVTKTILGKYTDDLNDISLPPTVCSICNENCNDLSEHFMWKMEKYMMSLEKICRSNPSVSDQLSALALDDWSWKPIDPPESILQELWISKKWTEVPHLVNELGPTLSILNDVTSSKIIIDSQTEKRAKIFSNIRPVVYLPDIGSLIAAIDDENRFHAPGRKQTVNEDNNHRVSTGTRLSIVNNVDTNSPLGQLCYDVKAPPNTIIDDSKCSD
ncbi:unnamed protein product, partial [Rotaria sp. Silwood2]